MALSPPRMALSPPLAFPPRTALYPEEGVPGAVLRPSEALRWLPARRELVRPSYGPDGAAQHLVFFLHHAEVVPRRQVRPWIRPGALDDPSRAALDPLRPSNVWTCPVGEEDAAADDAWWDPSLEDELAAQEADGDGGGGPGATWEERRERERALREARKEDLVVLSGVTQEGVSVAVAVRGWRPWFYLMPAEGMARKDRALGALRRLAEALAEGCGVPAEVQPVTAPRAYGFHPDPASPGERLAFPFLRVRASSQGGLRRLARALEDVLQKQAPLEAALAGGFGQQHQQPSRRPPPAGAAAALSTCLGLGGATIEEGDRLRPEFKFLDEREIPPASWVVVRRGKYRLMQPWEAAFSFRTLNAIAEDPRAVLPMEKLLALPKSASQLRRDVPLPLPDPNALPPSLFAYADIECRGAAADEFPEPTHPDAPCYMVGVSFVWAFGLPPALRRDPEPENPGAGPAAPAENAAPAPGAAENAAPWLASRLAAVDARAAEERARAVDAVRAARAERLRRRAERVARYARREDVLELLAGRIPGRGRTGPRGPGQSERSSPEPGTGWASKRPGAGARFSECPAGPRGQPALQDLIQELNSDDESEGEEAAVARAGKEADREADGERGRLRAMAAGLPWARGRGAAAGAAGSAAAGAMAEYAFLRVLLVVGRCAPIPGAVVVVFDAERELLQWLRALLFGLLDADGLRGYNWLGFDSRYLVRRAELHDIAPAALRWSHLPSRPPNYDSRGEVTLSLAKGIFRMVRLHGTNTVDMMIYMRQQLDLASYKLEAIAEHFGLEGKHPIKPEHIFAAYGGTPEQRAVVGAYCLRDCDVLADIARAAQFEVTLMQFARIMQTQPETMWTSGQQIRVVHQLIWQAHRQGFVVDGLFRDRRAEDRALRELQSGKSFSGGFVMKPAVAHYRTPTATLDYKSLYPSIMISHKLCFSTALLHPYDAPEWVARIQAAGREVVRIETESGTFHYVQHEVNLIPDMEWKLWTSRQAIKKEMKRTADPLLVAVLDAKQLAVKVSMNSTFGVTGAEHAMLGMKRIAASITHVGRTTVQAARDYADGLRGGGNGRTPLAVTVPARPGGAADPADPNPSTLTLPVLPPGGALRTVYGDTDSIMVNLPGALHPEAVRWAAGYAAALVKGDAAAEARLARLDPEAPLDAQMAADPDLAPAAAAALLLVCRYVGQAITDALNGRYRKPMEIEFEEVASQAIFLAPKMYTKNVVEDLGDAVIAKLARGGRVGKLKVAGIAAKRRDRSLVTKRLQKGVASAVVHAGDPARALQLVRRWVARLALNEVDVGDYLITTELKNPNERVGQAVQPHVAVAWALEKACRGSEPVRGERVPWLLVRAPDLTRLEPPPSRRTTGMDLHLPRVLSAADFARVTLAELRSQAVAARVAPTIPPAHQRYFFGDVDLAALPAATTTLGQIGVRPGHRLTVVHAFALEPSADPTHAPLSAAAKARVQFRVWLEDGGADGGDEDEEEVQDEDEAEEAGRASELSQEAAAPDLVSRKRDRAGAAAGAAAAATQGGPRSLTDRMMFHAREMTAQERANLGKRRVSQDKAASNLSVYARHPSEIRDLRQEVDARRYMEHVRSALEILLKTTRPDLWEQMHATLRRAEGVMDVAQGKPRQATLSGFFKRAGEAAASGAQ
jgi:DNA polymerase elongation subunit (family B)